MTLYDRIGRMIRRFTPEHGAEVVGDGDDDGYVLVETAPFGYETVNTFDSAVAVIQHYNTEIKQDDGRARIGTLDDILWLQVGDGPAGYGADGWGVDVYQTVRQNSDRFLSQHEIAAEALASPSRDATGDVPLIITDLHGPDDTIPVSTLLDYRAVADRAGTDHVYLLAESSQPPDDHDSPLDSPAEVDGTTYTQLMAVSTADMDEQIDQAITAFEATVPDLIAATVTDSYVRHLYAAEHDNLFNRVLEFFHLPYPVFDDRTPRDSDYYYQLLQDLHSDDT